MTAFYSRPFGNVACAALVGALAIALCGCSSVHSKKKPADAQPASGSRPNQQSIIVAPTATGKVASINQQARFVVLSFPIGQVPPPETRMVVYHGDAKTGEVVITGPTQDNLTVADIVLGVVQDNDEVRAH